MSPLAEQLLDVTYQAMQQGPRVLTEWLSASRASLSAHLGEEVRGLYGEAARAGNAGDAKAAAFAGIFLFLELGMPRESLSSYLDYYQVDYMLARDPDAYRQVREGCQMLLPKAKDIQAADLVFQLATLAGDAAFFA